MGRIVAVNLAHWRKGLLTRTENAEQDRREYHENVQERIETANEGRIYESKQIHLLFHSLERS